MTEKKPKLRSFSAMDLVMLTGMGVIAGGLIGLWGVAVGVLLIAGAWAMGKASEGPKSPEKAPEKPLDEKKG